MKKFGVSHSVRRKEDVRFLTGAGAYIDDTPPEGALFACFLYSPVAHAIFETVGVDAANAMDGVRAVITSEDLKSSNVRNRMEANLIDLPGGGNGADPARPVLAEGKVRFVGEPVAVVVADTLTQAKDAIEMIEFDYSEIEAHVDVEVGGEELHAEAPENVAFDWHNGDETAVNDVFENADHVVSVHLEDNRVIASSMEPRGCWADWKDDRLHFSFAGQAVWPAKFELGEVLGLERRQVHVTTPDVGGGFGMKAFVYPEYLAVAQAARMLGRPVRWISTRSEAMITDNSGRDLHSVVEGAFDKDYRLLGYKVVSHCNLGAYNSLYGQSIQTVVSQVVLTGVYDIPATFFRVKGIYTNSTPVDAYRGAGRPEAIYMIERLMDKAARRFGVDQLEIRRRNFIPPKRFPYRNFAGEEFDVGNFDKVLRRAELESDMDGFQERKAESAARGKLRGLGVCYYIEAILGDPSETTKMEFTEDGNLNVYVGTQSNGQGHETAFSQIAGERTGVPFEKVNVIQGDSDRIEEGGGTGGSRSVTAQGSSINLTSDKLIEKFTGFVAEELDAAVDQISFEDGTFHARGTNRFIGILDAASAARLKGRNDLLTTAATSELRGRSYPNGAHVCEVEIDPDTGATGVVRYTVVDDLGVLINPMLAEGQVHGGVAQGIGQAVTEHAVYDDTGQLLSGTFMDYAIPRADDVPFVSFHSEPTPSKNNPIGMKGCGEAGTIGTLAAVGNAVQDALWESGIHTVDMPFTPQRVWSLLEDSGQEDL